jgi:O-antigen/teichoic acid export membrane protein
MLKQLIRIFQKLKKNTFIMQSINTMILRVIGIITLFGFTLFLTHNYDPKIIGQYDFIRTFLLVLGSLCMLGTDQSVLYFAGILNSEKRIGKLREIYIKCILMFLISSLISIIILLILGNEFVNSFFNDNKIYVIIFKATAIIFFYCLTLFNTEVFRALDSIYIAELYRNTFKYVSVIIGSVILLNINKQSYLVDSFLIGFILLSIVSTIFIFKLLKKLTHEQVTGTGDFPFKFIFYKSYPFAISSMAIFLLNTFDIVFLKKYFGDSTIAFYSVALKLMTILSMIINVVNLTVSTKIAELFTLKKKKELISIIKNSSRLIFVLTLPMSIIICVFSENILTFFGPQYFVAKQALIILIFGQCINSLFGVAPIYLNMTGRQHLFQFILIIAVFTNLVLNSILVPKYGIDGAAFSFSISMFLWNLLSSFYIYKKDKIIVFLN